MSGSSHFKGLLRVWLPDYLVVIPIGPIVNPEMLSTLKFYCRNIIYGPNGWNLAWLPKVALWAICIISITILLR